MYATPQDMLDRYGAEEMAGISQPDDLSVTPTAALLRATVAGTDRSSFSPAEQGAGDACLARMAGALAEASRRLDAYLQTKYTLPIPAADVVNSPLPGYCSDVARYLLMDNRATEEVSRRHTAAMQWARDVAGGKALVGITGGTSQPAGMPDFFAPPSPWAQAMDDY